MAYIDPTQDPDQNNQNPSQVDQALKPAAQASGQPTDAQAPPTSGGGGSGVVSGGGAGGAPAPSAAAPKPSSSGSWTNLDSYLNANADQGANVGQQIAGTINDSGNKAQGDIGNLGVNFNSAVDQNTVNQDPNAVNGAITAATSATAKQGLTADQTAAYNNQAGANYAGPQDVTSFNGYSQAQQDVNDAQQKASATQSEAGRDVLLNNQYQNASANGYTQGENNLDQLLLQNSQGGQAALQPLAQQWSGLTGALNNTVASGNTAATNAAATDQATAQAATGALNTASQNFQTQLNTGLANLQQTDTAAWQNIQADLQSGGLTPQDYAAIGVDPSQHNYGTDRSQYLTQGAAPTLQTYATSDQYAQAAALAQLAGQSVSPYLAPDSTTAPQAGTATNAPAFSFDNTKYNSDNSTNQATYQTQVAGVLAAANSGFGFDNINVPGAGASDIGSAVGYLNNIIQKNSNGSGMANTEKQWALSQLNTLNQAQVQAGFKPYPIFGQNQNIVIK